MSFQQKCACLKHSDIAGAGNFKLFNLDKKCTVPFTRKLREKDFISEKGSYICSICISYAESDTQYSLVTSCKKRGRSYVMEIIDDTDQGNLETDDWQNITRALGRSQRHTLNHAAKHSTDNYKTNLAFLDMKQLLDNRNTVLLYFLLEITGLYGTSIEDQRARFMPLICALDCILAAAYDRTVTQLLCQCAKLFYHR